MTIHVERINGTKYEISRTPDRYHRGYIREYIQGECWTRAAAREALDLLQALYHLPRKNIRFSVR